MYFELCIICSIVFVVWVIGRLLMLFDIVHVPKKRVHIWRHVKHLNQVIALQQIVVRFFDPVFQHRASVLLCLACFRPFCAGVLLLDL